MAKQILQILDAMNTSNSSLHKINVMQEFSSNDKFRETLMMTYNPVYQYHFSPKSITAAAGSEEGIGFYGIIHLLKRMNNRELKKSDVNDMILFMNASELELFTLIIDRDLRVKVDAKTINKSMDETLIPVFSYMRCSLPKEANEIVYPAISQLKSDGMFVNVIVKDGAALFVTRNGKPIEIKSLETVFAKPIYEGLVFNGELLVMQDNKPMARQKGNGLLSSLQKRDATEETLEQKLIGANAKTHQKIMKELKDKTAEWDEIDQSTMINVWDVIPYSFWKEGVTYEQPYQHRFESLKDLIGENEKAYLIESRIVNSYDEAMEHFTQMRARGEEGTIVKNMFAHWENKTSKNQVKMKAEKEVELIVVGWNAGKDDFKDGIGSLICHSSCGRLQVNVSGMKRHQRGLKPVDTDDATKGLCLIEGFDLDCYTGKIITVRFNEVIQNKDTGMYSLFLPRIVEVRDDKNIADDLDYILKV